jgi:HAD superfamily hydrolase (TIGR01509 family)
VSDNQHAILFDLDGTLVDSVYQHVRIWHDVLREHGYHVAHHQVHKGIGLPSPRLLRWLIGRAVDDEQALVEQHDKLFLDEASTLTPTDGAIELLADLDNRDVPYLAVTSAGDSTREALFEALGRELPVAPKAGSKPHADPLLRAAASLKLTPAQLTMIGDATWDAEAAKRSGIQFIGVRCGGAADAQLLQAGALSIEDSPRALIGRL